MNVRVTTNTGTAAAAYNRRSLVGRQDSDKKQPLFLFFWPVESMM